MARDTSLIKERTRRKHQKVRDFFDKLYNHQRLRYEDSVEKTADEYDYSITTIETILRNTQQPQLNTV